MSKTICPEITDNISKSISKTNFLEEFSFSSIANTCTLFIFNKTH